MKGSTIAVLLVFAGLVLLVLVAPATWKQKAQNSFLQAVSPLLHLGNNLENRVGGVAGGREKLDELERENQQLKLDNERLRATNALLQSLQTEVDRLSRQLGFQASSPFTLIPGHIIARDNTTWWNTVSIDRGAENGLGEDMAVVTEDGLVGKITAVAKNSAVILLVTDQGLRVSVNIEGANQQGIISGTPSIGRGRPELRIRFLSKLADIKPGQKVVTAGTGGVFPSGVVLGTVKQFEVRELEGVATVEPAVDLAGIRDVFVIAGTK
jgi:rod shape-determining protein MreC